MSACINVTIHNGSQHVMVLTKMNDDSCDTCMDTSGPDQFSIPPGGSRTILLEDSNSAGCDCYGANKYIDWTVTENGINTRQFGFKSSVSPDRVWAYGDIIGAETNGNSCDAQPRWADRYGDQPIPVNIYL